MKNIQMLENENFIEKADFENYEVWLLNKTTEEEIDARIINVSEITESLEPSAVKFPQLFPEGVIPNDFEYEIITDSSEKYMVHSYVCDVRNIRIISSN